MLNFDASGMVNVLELYFVSCGLFMKLFRTCWNDVMLSVLMDEASFVLPNPLYLFS